MHDPPILILDEPTSDLDPNEKAEVIRYIKEIGKERTILLSTHNLSEVEAACARAIIVSKGRVVADGPLDDIRAKSGRSATSSPSTRSSVFEGGAGYRVGRAQAADGARRCRRRSPACPASRASPSCRPTTRRTASSSSARSGGDIRPELFQLIVQKGWLLLEMRRDAAEPRGRVQGPHQGRRAPGPRPPSWSSTRTTTRTRRRGGRRRGGDDEDDEDRRRRRRRGPRRTTATRPTRTKRAPGEEGLTMRTTLTIAKREFRSNFDSPLAYVVICLGLIALGFVFFYLGGGFWQAGRASLPQLFAGRRAGCRSWSSRVVTMRLLAEEKRIGTLGCSITSRCRTTRSSSASSSARGGSCSCSSGSTVLFPIMMFECALAPRRARLRARCFSGYLGLVLYSAAAVAIGLRRRSPTSQVIALLHHLHACSCRAATSSAASPDASADAARRRSPSSASTRRLAPFARGMVHHPRHRLSSCRSPSAA